MSVSLSKLLFTSYSRYEDYIYTLYSSLIFRRARLSHSALPNGKERGWSRRNILLSPFKGLQLLGRRTIVPLPKSLNPLQALIGASSVGPKSNCLSRHTSAPVHTLLPFSQQCGRPTVGQVSPVCQLRSAGCLHPKATRLDPTPYPKVRCRLDPCPFGPTYEGTAT
jgi:hypothetical protein